MPIHLYLVEIWARVGCTRKCHPFMMWYSLMTFCCSALLLMYLSSITYMKEHIPSVMCLIYKNCVLRINMCLHSSIIKFYIGTHTILSTSCTMPILLYFVDVWVRVGCTPIAGCCCAVQPPQPLQIVVLIHGSPWRRGTQLMGCPLGDLVVRASFSFGVARLHISSLTVLGM